MTKKNKSTLNVGDFVSITSNLAKNFKYFNIFRILLIDSEDTFQLANIGNPVCDGIRILTSDITLCKNIDPNMRFIFENARTKYRSFPSNCGLKLINIDTWNKITNKDVMVNMLKEMINDNYYINKIIITKVPDESGIFFDTLKEVGFTGRNIHNGNKLWYHSTQTFEIQRYIYE